MAIINEEDTNKLDIITQDLKEQTSNIAQRLIAETDIGKVKDLTQLFNAAHIKKQVLRTMAYDEILDHINDQMAERIIQRGDQFSNKDLIDYANSVTSHLEKAQKQISGVNDIPVIQINQQNNTIITDTLDSESQQRVESAIKAILEKIKLAKVEDTECINSDNSDISVEEITVYDNDNDGSEEEDSQESFNYIKLNEEEEGEI